VLLIQKVLKLSQYIFVLPRVKLPLFPSLQHLQLEEVGQEGLITFTVVDVDVQDGLETLETLGVLGHG
jgi:hypothetical protein